MESPIEQQWRRKGLCFRCGKPGQFVADCQVARSQRNVTIPGAAASQPPQHMYYGSGGLQETPYGSGGYTSSGASPSQQPSSSTSPSPGLANNGNSTPMFDPHLLTVPFAYQGKATCSDDLFWVRGREECVVDSRATFHVTGNPFGMVDCYPPPTGKSSLVVTEGRVLWSDSNGGALLSE